MKRFRIRYSAGSIPAAWDTFCSTPITALNQFHKHMQIELAKKPEDYKLEKLVEVYNTDPTGNNRGITVESPFDLPTSPNPLISTKPELGGCQDDTNLMAFYDDIPISKEGQS